jgi:N-acetylmuramoyl-L-alanine amidase
MPLVKNPLLFKMIFLLGLLLSTKQLPGKDRLLVLRNAPLQAGPEDYFRAIDTIKSQEIIEMVEQKGSWYLIQLPNGKAGWLKAEYVKPLKEANSSPRDNAEAKNLYPVSLKVHRQGNLRDQPSITARIITRLSIGEVVKQLGQEGDWFYVQTQDGTTGWSNAILFKSKTSETPLRQARLIKNGNLRQAANIGSPIIKLLPSGTIVTFSDSLGEWYRVQLGDTNGWIHRSVITSK